MLEGIKRGGLAGEMTWSPNNYFGGPIAAPTPSFWWEPFLRLLGDYENEESF